MNNGWTGGQYSLYRVVLGAGCGVYSARQLAHLPDFTLLLPELTLLLCLLFMVGIHDRWAALPLCCLALIAYTYEPSPEQTNWLFIAGLFLAHLCLPAAPYGSWSAHGRTDPGAGWRIPPFVYTAAWIMLALAYGYRGFEASQHSTAGAGLLLAGSYRAYAWIALAFPLLVFFRPLRPWLWLVMFLLLLLLLPTGREPLAFGLLLLHGLTFDPAWIKGAGNGVEPIFYDGHCGLCHRAVRFVLAEDVNGAAFRFAPLDSDAFRAAVSEEERAKLPDSMVVKTADGAVLTRSTAFLHILRRLGGLWRVLALVGGLVPAPLRDAAYNGVARIRRKLFAAPNDACPVLPKELRQRFDY